jgi:hypothetical protein
MLSIKDDTPGSPGGLLGALAGAITAKQMAPAWAKCRP